jgi:hypothetical protein
MVKMDKPPVSVCKGKYGDRFTIEQVQNLEHHQIPPHYSHEIHSLISACLKTDASERPTICELLRFPGVISEVNELESSREYHKKLW